MSYPENDDRVWDSAYRDWLKAQGAEIVRSDKGDDLLRNAIGIAPGHDKFGFNDEQDAVLFMLKWS